MTAFIDTMLGTWYPASDRDRFLAGLTLLDLRSMEQTAKPFIGSAPPNQLSLLQLYDAEVDALREANHASANAHWFAMLKYMTVWGYCTSEVAMRDTLQTWPQPMRYDGNASFTR